MDKLIRTNSLLNLAGGGEKFDFLPQQNLRKERDIWYKIKLIYSVLVKKISFLLSVDYYKSNNENQFKDIQLQLHATNVTNPYTFSIQGNKSFSGIPVLNTVTLTVRRYETDYQTLTTIYNGRTYNNEVTLKVVKGSSVRVYSGGKWSYPGYIIVNGTNSRKEDYTFTVITDTTVTTSQPFGISDDLL